MKTKLTFLFIGLFYSFSLHATHNRAGEIIYEQTGQLSILAQVKTYTKTSSQAADRDSLEICWGDGECQWVLRSNGIDMDGDGYPDGGWLMVSIMFVWSVMV